MTQLLYYIPGYQEPEGPKYPGKVIEKYCGAHNISFQRLVLPGDIRYNQGENDAFSMSALVDKIQSILNSIDGDISLATYSLSTRPTIDAITGLSDTVKLRIKKLSLIHPARNPLYSVRVRDWLQTDNKELLPEKYYLDGDTQEVFNSLIGEWRGDGKRFQEDLRVYNQDKGGVKYLVRNLGVNHSEFSSIDDKVINEGPLGKKSSVMISHIPKLTDTDIREMLE